MVPFSDIIINGNEINLMTVLIVVAIIAIAIVGVYYAKRL
jgi:uncharacterized protein YneF (UPF0154 family)